MPDKKLGLLYFGRMDDEKGFGLILDMLKRFIKDYGELPFSIYVFGKGKYVQDLLNISAKHNSIHFFGWQPLETIQRYKENCQYCLVPSMFLETFGLTALNSLSMGLPVVGFSKGGLKQFVPNKYDISKTKGQNDGEKLYNKINELFKNYESKKTDIEKEKKWAKNMAKKYSIEKRFENAQELIGKPKRVLMVTDFKSKLGGIETYIYDVKDILIEKGYEVQIYGAKIPKGRLGQMLKYFGLFFAMWNFVDAIRLKKVVKKFKPKVVRYHSTIRRIGRLPIKTLSSHMSKKFMMYHDLGYFHPFPSDVTKEDMIQTPTNLSKFIKSYKTKNPIKIIAIFFKYLSVCLLKNQLKKSVDRHLVPSSFLEKIVSDGYQIESKKVQTLSHFIQK
ncbi:MAG TPA: glycosyltransferase [Candidatus Absconditabacterales bacterium]|nr:glycosyltransferase [Candidatus Absconditabacterales bacterium]